MMREELTERVETVYEDVFWFPLLIAIAFLFNETFVFDTPWRNRGRPEKSCSRRSPRSGR